MSKKDSEDEIEEGSGLEKTKHRSPNYPMVGLRKAVERVKQLHDKYKRAAVPINLAHELWGYTPHGNSGNQCVAALKSYGLIDVEGVGKGRRVRVSDVAYKIVLDHPDRIKLLKLAVLAPAVYKELFNRFDALGYSPDLIKHYLQFDREDGVFNPEVVDGVIANFLDSVKFTGIRHDIIDDDDGKENEPAQQTTEPGESRPVRTPVQVGSLVQWESNGMLRLPEPKRVVGFHNNDWAFLEGSETGVPISELTIMEDQKIEPNVQKNSPAAPPLNPYFRPQQVSRNEPEDQFAGKAGMAKAETTLDEGPVVIRWPSELSADSVHDLEHFFEGLIARARRKAGIKLEKKP